MLSNLFKNAVEASPKKEKITFTLNHGESLSVGNENLLISAIHTFRAEF